MSSFPTWTRWAHACLPSLAAALVAMTPTNARCQQRPEVPLSFERYHGYADVRTFLTELSSAYPDLARVYPMAQDFKGLDMLVIEITNRKTGKADDKPAFFADGNIDNDEAAATELLLGLARKLVTQYGIDPEITKLLDGSAFYLVPMVNPYMSDLFVSTPMNGVVSSINARPFDDDEDGGFDEDPPEDVNGDGMILTMRRRDVRGEYRTDPGNPRLMVRRKPDEPGEWAVYDEGFDNDGDGLINEDPIGGIDLNRNFPPTWKPEWIQEGAGPYPLSEPESRGWADFIRAHPNICFTVNGHGGPSEGIIYRVYSSMPDTEIPRQDFLTFQTFANRFAEISGGLKLIGNYGAEAEKRFGPGRLVYGYGTMKEWVYEMAGAFSFTVETGMLPGDYDKDGEVSDAEYLRVSDEEFGGRLFVDYKPFRHPTLGDVEIGGFTKWTKPNPPPGKYLAKLVDTYGKMSLYWASTMPHLAIRELVAQPVPGGYRVESTVENAGFLPTNVTEKSIQNGYAAPVWVTLTASPNVEVIDGTALRRNVGHLQGIGFNFPRAVSSGGGPGGVSQSRDVSWMVHVKDGASAWVEVTAATPKAGIAVRRITLPRSPSP
ncbi:MAG: hypothetical protein FIA95_13760 [Gemmatimonadetes bacterium]|nr:hypothetical protein [Gemmatimonadota bacterium]